tara:strand:- start:13220 stop:14011 length:792 start_codon:yes stop_codon:yes gene_type:complete
MKKEYGLITGASGLLGVEHALALLEIGINPILTDINIKKLKNQTSILKKKYPKSEIIFYKMNVTNENSVKKIKNKITSKKKSIKILINNAAIDNKIVKNKKTLNHNSLDKIKLNSVKAEIDVGLIGAVICIKYFGPLIAKRKNGGVIINIGSDLSVISPNQNLYNKGQYKPVTYSIIKHGLIGLTKYVSTFWSKNNVRCNTLSPGPIHHKQPVNFIKKLKKEIPLNRLAKKNDYRSAIQFMCSDASSYLNGHNLIIDGGRSVW